MKKLRRIRSKSIIIPQRPNSQRLTHPKESQMDVPLKVNLSQDDEELAEQIIKQFENTTR